MFTEEEDVSAVKEGEEQVPPVDSASTDKKPDVTPVPKVEGGEEAKPGETHNSVGFEFKKLRSERRAIREELERERSEKETLRAELEELRSRYIPPENDTSSREDVLDVRAAVREEIRNEKLSEERSDALNHILSQDDIKSEDTLKEIVEVMKTTGLDVLAKSHPYHAAELGLREWRRTKTEGKASSIDKERASDLGASSRGGAQHGGKRVYTRDEIAKMSDEDYEKNRSDILTAKREGRVK